MRTRVLHTQGPAKDVRFCLLLPRESLSIPVMRRVLGDTLSRLGLDDDCVADLLLAVTEACTNVVRHAGAGHRYEVVAQVGRTRCVLQVLDTGRGFSRTRARMTRRSDPRRPPVRQALLRRRRPASPGSTDSGGIDSGGIDIGQLAESGRGLAIMRACVDDVSLHTGPGKGTVVKLRKRIELREGAPLADLGSWALKDAS